MYCSLNLTILYEKKKISIITLKCSQYTNVFSLQALLTLNIDQILMFFRGQPLNAQVSFSQDTAAAQELDSQV